MGSLVTASLVKCCLLTPAMFVIEALHPDGWRRQGRTKVEYWAYQEAQTRCCSDGRTYRILDEDTQRIMAMVNTSSCRAVLVSN